MTDKTQAGTEGAVREETEAAAGNAVPEVSIIIVNWKSVDYLGKCLQSVYKFTQGARFEVIVIDSASYDGCGEMLAREFPGVKFIQSGRNIGFGGTNNLGAKSARGRHLLLLNPDTALREDSIKILMDRIDSLPRAGAVGPRLLNADGSLQTSCVQSFPTVLNQMLDSEFFRRLFPRWRIWGTGPLHSLQPAEAEAVSGACILVQKEAFEKVGGFSSHYFMYGEDLDLCFKFRQAGYRVYHVPETTLVHFGGGSTGNSNISNVMMRESVYQFLRHNRGKVSAACYRAAMAAASVVRMLLILPLLAVSGKAGNRPRLGSLRKWLAIFRWSLGLATLAPAQS